MNKFLFHWHRGWGDTPNPYIQKPSTSALTLSSGSPGSMRWASRGKPLKHGSSQLPDLSACLKPSPLPRQKGFFSAESEGFGSVYPTVQGVEAPTLPVVATHEHPPCFVLAIHFFAPKKMAILAIHFVSPATQPTVSPSDGSVDGGQLGGENGKCFTKRQTDKSREFATFCPDNIVGGPPPSPPPLLLSSFRVSSSPPPSFLLPPLPPPPPPPPLLLRYFSSSFPSSP